MHQYAQGYDGVIKYNNMVIVVDHTTWAAIIQQQFRAWETSDKERARETERQRRRREEHDDDNKYTYRYRRR